mgnify:FL=1|tara:strand:+ start:1314 stop:2192 length:879 start_codon:yes stop_codon:yes gene_type:complete
MRSKICLILLALFAFSCSSDSSSDDGNNNNNGGNNNTGNALLVSEIIETDAEVSDYVYTDRYFYDGNKLTSIVEEYSYQGGNSGINYLYNFIYTNNKISRVDEYYGDTSTGIEGRYTFEYDNQGRVSFYDYCYFDSSGNCEEYDTNNLAYSSNGTVTNSYVYNVGSDYEDAGTLTLQLDNNGNIISGNDSYQDVDNSGNPITVTVNASFQYDNQNSPFKNIVGMDALILVEFGSDILQFNAYNNCTSYSIEYSDEDEVYAYNYAYDFNEDGYPRQVIVTQGSYSSTIDINYY